MHDYLADVLTSVEEVLGKRPESPEVTLEDLGMTAFDQVDLLVRLEERYGVELPDDFPTGAKVADIVTALEAVDKDLSK